MFLIYVHVIHYMANNNKLVLQPLIQVNPGKPACKHQLALSANQQNHYSQPISVFHVFCNQ